MGNFTLSDLASAVSIVLALVAIALSILFYILSTKLSEVIRTSAENINSNVDRINKLFELFYTDTFSMMKDTYTDMRRSIWSDSGLAGGVNNKFEEKTNEKIEALKKAIQSDLSKTLESFTQAGAQMEIQKMLDKAIEQTRQATIEARSDVIRNRILGWLRSSTRNTAYRDVMLKYLLEQILFEFSESDVMQEISRMEEEGIIQLHELSPKREIYLRYENPKHKGRDKDE